MRQLASGPRDNLASGPRDSLASMFHVRQFGERVPWSNKLPTYPETYHLALPLGRTMSHAKTCQASSPGHHHSEQSHNRALSPVCHHSEQSRNSQALSPGRYLEQSRNSQALSPGHHLEQFHRLLWISRFRGIRNTRATTNRKCLGADLLPI